MKTRIKNSYFPKNHDAQISYEAMHKEASTVVQSKGHLVE